MITNKDKGTSVGFSNDKNLGDLWPEFFSEKNFDKLPEFLKNNSMNKEGEHEWVEKSYYPKKCSKCGQLAVVPSDFKISENVEQINKQQWEDIQDEFEKTEFFIKSDGYLFKWLKENFLAPEKK